MSKLIIEPSPHIKSCVTTQKIMLSVIIALFPALFASVWIFGLRALIMTVICCTSCVIFGVDLISAGLSDRVLNAFVSMLQGPGAVADTLAALTAQF